MEQKLFPAPIDGKNVTTEWLEDVFDFANCTSNGKDKYMGFVNGIPVMCFINDNTCKWYIGNVLMGTPKAMKTAYDELEKRLKGFDDDTFLTIKYEGAPPVFLQQSFYFTND